MCERGIDGQCGYPGCGNPVKKRGAGSRYHVSLSEHKVYDRSTMREFCSNDCARRSQEYARGLSTVSLFLRKGAVAVQAAPAHAVAAHAQPLDGAGRWLESAFDPG